MYGFHNRGGIPIPDWAGTLTSHYWRIRVEGRDKAKKRKYYRYVAKEKLRLAEQGIDQDLIKAVCRYLVSLNASSGYSMEKLLQTQNKQLSFNF